MTYDVVALGELLYVLRAPYTNLLEYSKTLNCHCAGAEANVAIGSSQLGLEAAFISKICENFMGRFLIKGLQSNGVNVDKVIRVDHGRMGVLFQEFGIPPRPSNNVYDRFDSVFLTLTAKEIDWSILKKAKCLFTSGVTAALNNDMRSLIHASFQHAKESGVITVFDANFRSSLWSIQEAKLFLEKILHQVDICFLKYDDVRSVLGAGDTPEETLKSIRDQYGIDVVVMTLNATGAIVNDGNGIYFKKAIDVPHIVNRFGLGDAFVAGFLCGYFKYGLHQGLDYAIAAAALKSTYVDENAIQFGEDLIMDLIEYQKANPNMSSLHSYIKR